MGDVVYHEFTAPGGESFKVRSVVREGAPWFVGADLAKVLALTNLTMACRILSESEVGNINPIEVGDLFGGKPRVIITESGLYKLILRSDKPNAKPFQDLVTKDVLPAIRKTGGYLLNEAARPGAHADTRDTMPVPETFAQALRAHAETLLKLATSEEEKVRLASEIERLQPQAAISQRHFARMDHMKLSRFVRTLDGVNSNKTKSDLERLGYLFNASGTYRVYSGFRDKLFVEKRDERFGGMDIYPTEAGRALSDCSTRCRPAVRMVPFQYVIGW